MCLTVLLLGVLCYVNIVVCVPMVWWCVDIWGIKVFMTKFQGLNNLAYSITFTQQHKQKVIYQGGRFDDQKSLWQIVIHHTFVRWGVCDCHKLKMV